MICRSVPSERKYFRQNLYRKSKHTFFLYKIFFPNSVILLLHCNNWYAEDPRCYPILTLPSCYEARNLNYWTPVSNLNFTLCITAVSWVCGQAIVRLWSGLLSTDCNISSRTVIVWRCGCHVISVNRFQREHVDYVPLCAKHLTLPLQYMYKHFPRISFAIWEAWLWSARTQTTAVLCC